MIGYTVRCQKCSSIVHCRPKAKTPKYCPTCRRAQQDQFRKKVAKSHKARTEGQKIEPIN